MTVSDYIVPILLLAGFLYAAIRKTPVFDAFVEGAREGLQTAVRVLPSLAAMMLLTALLRYSGIMDALIRVLTPALNLLGIPPETAAMFLVRPLSGAAATAELTNVLAAYGPDSAAGRTASVFMGSSETILYTVTVYLSAAKVKRSRHAIPVAILASIAAAVSGAALVRLLFK